MSKEDGSNIGSKEPGNIQPNNETNTGSILAISSGTVFKHMDPDTAAGILGNIVQELKEALKEGKGTNTVNQVIAQEAVNNLG